MSVSSEITRLSSAKAAIKTAIENKGVTVPSSAKLDDYASLIDDISTGGGGAILTPTAGDYPVIENAGIGRISATSLTTTGISITIPVAGTYRLKWSAFRSSTSGTNSSRLYRTRSGSTSAIGTEVTAWTNSYYQANTLDIECNAGDVIIVYARSRGTTYYVCAGNLSACVAQKLWTN